MKNTLVSLKDEMKKSGDFHNTPVTGLTFPSTMDFTPHAENYLGTLPMLYSFSEDFRNHSGSVEIKDGYFSLLPFLMKETSSQVVLPELAARFKQEYLSSVIRYKDQTLKYDYCFALMDYYQELSSSEHLSACFSQLMEMASKHEKVKVAFSVHALSSRKPNMSHVFYEKLRELPANVEIISNSELFDQTDFRGRSVFLLTDKDFVLKSPWENIFAGRGAIINGMATDSGGDIVYSVPLSEKATKVVIRRKGHPIQSKDLVDFLSNLVGMIQSQQDLLNPEYLRQMRETLKLLKTDNHVA